MNSLVTFFGCGRVEPYYLGSAVNFVVTKFSDITEKIIPFFDKYPLRGSKAKDFSDFCKVVELMKKKGWGPSPQGIPNLLRCSFN
jgi:pentatricopeptide repeat protein